MSIAGKNVVLSGEVVGYSRGTAQALLQDLGARVQSSLGASTEVLIVGAKPGPAKLKKAAEMPIPVIPWDQAISGGEDHGESATTAVAVAQGVRAISPQLAKKSETVPHGGNWLYEIKWDGYRCTATIIDGAVAMASRSGLSEYAEQFPRVAAALATLPNCILDGELIVVGEDGVTNFQTTHTAGRGAGEAFVVFDIIELEGEDLRRKPLTARRAILMDLLAADWNKASDVLRISSALDEASWEGEGHPGEWLLNWVAEQKMEGIVAKSGSSFYVEGSRTDAWQKIKVRLQDEYLIVGYTPGEGARAWAFGALILARYDAQGELVYCGKCGTGFDEMALQVIGELMRALPAKEIPHDFPNKIRKEGIGIEPRLIAEVAFQRQTNDGVLWHPSYLRMRTDKKPEEVVIGE